MCLSLPQKHSLNDAAAASEETRGRLNSLLIFAPVGMSPWIQGHWHILPLPRVYSALGKKIKICNMKTEYLTILQHAALTVI